MTVKTNVLDKVLYPDDLKKLSVDEMKLLADEIRPLIIKKVNATGGHMSPNLGIVEATIAMHYVFDTPKDKIIYDVSHQCYPHKILTGRKEGFTDPDKYLKYTGYTAPEESEYDLFKVGHTSTAASLACGVAKARDLKGEKYNVIAVVGDGSLTGGEALEGLDNCAILGSNVIIVINDNDMSIAENYGGICGNLKLLRETNGSAECNFFKAMGYDYYYVSDGNDIEQLIQTFEKAKDLGHPVLVHINTLKGKGLKVAEENKEMFHWIMPNLLDDNNQIVVNSFQDQESYTSITKDFFLKKLENDKTISVINAATPGVFGFVPDYRKQLGKNYTDVGICEEHSVAYASALAKMGTHPFLCIMSSFVQRTYDQLSQDLCLNNSPLCILVYWGGISGADATHLCSFDIPLISNIPNMVYMAPTNKEEYLAMLEYAYKQKEHPIAIRVPSCELTSSGCADDTDYSLINKSKIVYNGEKIAIIGAGNFFGLAKEVKDELKITLGIDATLINPVYLSGVDKELMESLKRDHSIVVTLEDGQIDGGFGEKVARFFGSSDIKVLNYGAKKEFTDRVPLDELYTRYRLTKELIAEDINGLLLR